MAVQVTLGSLGDLITVRKNGKIVYSRAITGIETTRMIVACGQRKYVEGELKEAVRERPQNTVIRNSLAWLDDAKEFTPCNYAVGTIVEGEIRSFNVFCWWVRLPDGTVAMLHVSQGKRGKHYKDGEKISVKIMSNENFRVSVTARL